MMGLGGIIRKTVMSGSIEERCTVFQEQFSTKPV